MRTLFFAALVLAVPGIASAQLYSGATTDYSMSVGTTPVMVIPNAGRARQWERVINVGSSNQGTVWCSRSLGANVAPNAAGAFPLAPNGNSSGQPNREEFSTPSFFVPNTALWCVSGSGTVPVTAEAAPN